MSAPLSESPGDVAGGNPVSNGGVDIAGLITLIVFYLIILAIGGWAGWLQRRRVKQDGRAT